MRGRGFGGDVATRPDSRDARTSSASASRRWRREVLDFLATLVLFPPDDTASNLNPGDRAGDPQDPAGHGSIHLGVLFQISEEGAE